MKLREACANKKFSAKQTKINICFQFFSAQRLKVARTTSKYVMFRAILTDFTRRKHLLPVVEIHRFSKLQTANMLGYLKLLPSLCSLETKYLKG